MFEFNELVQESSRKVNQTMLSNPCIRHHNISLVNDRVFSPLPSYKSKTQITSPKKLRKVNQTAFKKIQTSKFKLPGFAADYKELISPFAIRTRDYSVIYNHYIKPNPEFVHFPSIRPKYSLLKSPKRLRYTNYGENIASKKQLSLRKSNI